MMLHTKYQCSRLAGFTKIFLFSLHHLYKPSGYVYMAQLKARKAQAPWMNNCAGGVCAKNL